MKRFVLVAAVAAAVSLAACSGPNANQDTGTIAGAVLGGIVGNQFGKGGGKVAATMAGAVIGGIVGNEIGRKLDERDRMLAREAEYEAWERGPPGRPVKWRNPENGRYGEIVADDYYERAGRRCRNFYHRVYIDGRPETMRGTACRNPDGTWGQIGGGGARVQALRRDGSLGACIESAASLTAKVLATPPSRHSPV